MDSYFKKEPISIEVLVTRIEKYASRRVILDFLNKGVERKFINKIFSTGDRRKFYMKPTEVTIREYNQWSNEFTKSIV